MGGGRSVEVGMGGGRMRGGGGEGDWEGEVG